MAVLVHPTYSPSTGQRPRFSGSKMFPRTRYTAAHPRTTAETTIAPIMGLRNQRRLGLDVPTGGSASLMSCCSSLTEGVRDAAPPGATSVEPLQFYRAVVACTMSMPVAQRPQRAALAVPSPPSPTLTYHPRRAQSRKCGDNGHSKIDGALVQHKEQGNPKCYAKNEEYPACKLQTTVARRAKPVA